MSFQRFDISPNPGAESKRPHLSVFRFASFQSASRRPSQAPPAYSPNDVLATKNQLHVKILHWLRIAIASITFIISVVILACSASALRTYTGTRYHAEWVLPLWPSVVDLRPTHALLACGIILSVTSIFYLVVALVPTPLRSTRALNITFTLLSFVSLFMTIFTTVFANTINSHLSNSTQAGTLASWTCRWQGFGAAAPGRFSEICATSTAALDLVILMIVIESFSVLLAGWGWWVGARVKKEAAGGKGEVAHV
ncbi:MAG: hypothetical protein L6R40_001580 [Gallowayella cf. fulva]|nr:MAG: hypothetical protein L6R40_001580 [Xanthomendoza cf. fulva]